MVRSDHRSAGRPAANSPHCRNDVPLMSLGGTGRISVGSWLGMAGMAVVGIAGGALALVAVFLVLLGFEELTQTAAFVVFAGLTMFPSTILWLKGNRYLRGTAVGLAIAFLSATFVVMVWHPWDTMSDEEVERAKAEVLASGHPAFYLGDEVEGFPLNIYELDVEQANFFYGDCRPAEDADPEAECIADISIHNWWSEPYVGGYAKGACVRQEAVAGVPTVHIDHRESATDAVVLFTGDSQVTIEVADSSLEETLRIAREVRPVGAQEAATSLMPPTPDILSYVEKHCVPAQ